MLRSLAAFLGGAVAVNAIATISVKGSKFFTSEGNQFYVKGMQVWVLDLAHQLTT